MKHGWIAIAGLALLGLPACSSDDGGSDASGMDTSAPGDTAAPGDTGDAGDTGPTALPRACDEERPCSGAAVCRSGVCLSDPPASESAVLSDPTTNTPSAETPDLACLDAEPAPPAGPATATMFGAVDRFGSGRKTFNIVVDVFLAEGWDPSACEAETDEDDQTACYRAYGTPVGSTRSFEPVDVGTPVCDITLSHADCPLGYECIGDEVTARCELQFGLYAIEGVPTNTPLVVRSRVADDEQDFIKSKWHDTYMFNVILYADQVDGEGRARYDVTMVSDAQWELTPNSVGLPPVDPDRGAIGGRIRDCRQPGVRDSWPIGGVVIGLANPAVKVVYFNNLEDDTVPLVDRATTNILGRYAALDVPPGWNVAAGAVRLGGEVRTVGSARVYVVPNALAIVSWPGLQPYWKQEMTGELPNTP